MRTIASSVLVAAMVASISAFAQAPNFAGVWKLDMAKSGATGGAQGARTGNPNGGMGGGLGLGPAADELTITQTATGLVVEERRASSTSTLKFLFDGKTVTNRLPAGRNSGSDAAYVSTWRDGRLVTTVTTTDVSNLKVTYTETRYLNPDGTLVVETTRPGMPNARRAVYAKIK